LWSTSKHSQISFALCILIKNRIKNYRVNWPSRPRKSWIAVRYDFQTRRHLCIRIDSTLFRVWSRTSSTFCVDDAWKKNLRSSPHILQKSSRMVSFLGKNIALYIFFINVSLNISTIRFLQSILSLSLTGKMLSCQR
jgi:hypothetical protein